MASDTGFEKVDHDADFEKHDATPEEETRSRGEINRILSRINESYIADTLGAPVDWVNKLLSMQGVSTSDKPFLGSESIKSGMRALGMSEKGENPQTMTGGAIADVGGSAVSAMLGGGAIGAATKGLGGALGSSALKATGEVVGSPSGNIAAGAGAGAGGNIGGEAFKDTSMEGPARSFGEFIGGAIGGISPSTHLRPPNVPDPVLGAYERLKLAPSAAEAGVGGRTAQWLEGNILPQTIGGSNVMEAFRQKRLRQLTDIQQNIAEAYGAPKPRAEMGKSVQDSVMDTWVQNKQKDGQLIGALKTKYGKDVVYPENFVDAVANPIGGAESKVVRETTQDPLMQEAANIIRTTSGHLTFSDLAALKTKYGGALEPGFQKNTNDAHVEQLFNAVRKDMESHIKTTSPDDYAALKASNARYSEAQQDFKKYFKKLVGTKDVPVSSERAYEILTASATDKARGDIEEFKHVWDALPPEERGNLSATVLSRLGALDKGKPENPETWSLGKFISGYRDMSDPAKSILFKGNKDLAKQLDDLVEVTQNIQDRVTRLASTSRSGTGAIILGQFGIGALASHIASGDVSGFLYTMGGPYVMAQVLTNPTAVKAIANTLRYTNSAIDATARAGIALQAIPKVKGTEKLQGGAAATPDQNFTRTLQ